MDKIATKEALERVSQVLNDKIEQQATIVVPIVDYEAFTDEEKEVLRTHIKNGTIYNVVLKFTISEIYEETSARIIALADTGANYIVYYYCPDEGGMFNQMVSKTAQ